MTRLSTVFPSVKIKTPKLKDPITTNPSSSLSPLKQSSYWSVYLVISTNTPLKTYVGATTSFQRRLKQHNGELKGGAKATRSGRPWICACLIEGFIGQSEASEFEAKWKSFSRKLPRKKFDDIDEQGKDCSLSLLRHRKAALSRVEGSIDCSHLDIKWHLSPL